MVGKYIVASEVYGEYVAYAKENTAKGLVAISWEAWLVNAMQNGAYEGIKTGD